MKALAFIRAFETFMARRGTPDIVINDNFKTFKSSIGNKFMLCLGVPQKFILPASTCWGCVLQAINEIGEIGENVIKKDSWKTIVKL